MEEAGIAFNILQVNLGISRRRWDDNIIIDLEEVDFNTMNLFDSN